MPRRLFAMLASVGRFGFSLASVGSESPTPLLGPVGPHD